LYTGINLSQVEITQYYLKKKKSYNSLRQKQIFLHQAVPYLVYAATPMISVCMPQNNVREMQTGSKQAAN